MRSLAVACLFSEDAPFCARPAKGKLKYENPPPLLRFFSKISDRTFTRLAPIVSPISIEERQQSGEIVDLERAGRKKLLGVARGKAKHRGENGGGRGPKGRWNHGRAPRAADHLSLSRIFHRGSQGNCFLRFIVLFRLTGAMISLLVLYSSRQYRAIMAAYLLPFFSPFPSSSERNDPSTFHPPPLFFLRIHPSRFLLPVYRTYFFSRERGREGGSLLSKARHLREKGGCGGWLGW